MYERQRKMAGRDKTMSPYGGCLECGSTDDVHWDLSGRRELCLACRDREYARLPVPELDENGMTDTGLWIETCAICHGVRLGHVVAGRFMCEACFQRIYMPDEDSEDLENSESSEDIGLLWEHPPFPLLGVDELLIQRDPDWLIDGLVPEGLAVVYGAPSTFKSFLTLDWALCVATGTPWHGRPVKPGHVVYVAGEGAGGLRQRVAAWIDAHDAPDMSRVHFVVEAVHLLDDEHVERTRSTLKQLPEPPQLLVVDTMSRALLGGEENSSRDVGRFIAAVDAQQTRCRLVVHHTGANGERERGSSALRGACDVMVRVEREDHAPRLDVICDKPPKDGEPWATMTLRQRPAGGSLVLEPVSAFNAAQEAQDERREKVLAFVTEHGPASTNKIENGVGGKRELVRQALEELYIEGALDRVLEGRSKVYSVVRPSLWGEPGANGANA